MEGNKLDSRLSNVSEKLGMVLDKALCEEDFMIDVLLNGEKVLVRFADVNEEDIQQIVDVKEKIITFFGGNKVFGEKISEIEFKNQVLDYAKEKYTYVLATKRAGIVQTIVWVS